MPDEPANSPGIQRCGIFIELPKLLHELGFDPAPLLDSNGFSLTDFADQENILPFTDVVRLLEDCARKTNRRHFGLLLGLRGRTDHFGVIGEVMRNAPTLGRAAAGFVEHHHRTVRGSAAYFVERELSLEQNDERLLIGYRCLLPLHPVLQLQLVSMGAGFSMIQELTGVKPAEVLLGCSRTFVPHDEVQALLRPATVTYDAKHFALVLPASAADLPVIGADPKAYRRALATVHGYWNGVEPDFVDQVKRLLLPVLLAERAHMPVLSDALNMHPRTINRRLKEHGTSLRALVNQARFEVAQQLLGNTHQPVAYVAETMGYSEPGVFVRAFRQWSGQTPEAWRKSNQTGQE